MRGNGWEKWPPLAQGEALADTDGDGMPDEWETANGLNPQLATDGNLTDAEGYTNLERYMNALVSHIMDQENLGGTMLDGQAAYDLTGITPLRSGRYAGSYAPAYRLDGIVAPQLRASGIYVVGGRKVVVKTL